VVLDDGRAVLARRLLVTTGLVDALPDVPGVAERWGHEVVHCPYCHGWEIRGQALGVLAGGPLAVHQALLFRQWTADVTLFLHTAPEPTDEEWEQLAARGIAVVDGEVERLEVADGRLTGVRVAGGRVFPREAVAVMPRFGTRSDLLAALGLGPTALDMGGHDLGTYLAADPTGATAVPGVWAAGNLTDPRAGVVNAAAAGLTTATFLNADLVAEDTRLAVAARRVERASFSSRAGQESLVPGPRPQPGPVPVAREVSG